MGRAGSTRARRAAADGQTQQDLYRLPVPPEATHLTVVMPAYLTRFACLGSACEDTCCVGWQVGIDSDTYARYQHVKDPELGPLLRSRVRPRPPAEATREDYARIEMDPERGCPFLTPDRLCGVQLKLGEALLCNTCHTYPRSTVVADGQVERAAKLSCPEIARLALLDPDAMQPAQVQVPRGTRFGAGHVIPTATLPPGDPRRCFRQLRTLAVHLLQRRDVPAEARLVALGLVLRKLSDRPTLTPQEVEETFAPYLRSLHDVAAQVAGIAPRYALAVGLLRELVRLRAALPISSRRYQLCLDRITAGLRLDLAATDGAGDGVLEAYQHALQNYYMPYIMQKPYVLENILVNDILVSPFPFCWKESLFEDYVMLVVRYAMIKLHLIGVAACEQKLTDELLIEVVQPFQRAVDHNAGYLRAVRDWLRANGVTSMAYMAVLIVS